MMTFINRGHQVEYRFQYDHLINVVFFYYLYLVKQIRYFPPLFFLLFSAHLEIFRLSAFSSFLCRKQFCLFFFFKINNIKMQFFGCNVKNTFVFSEYYNLLRDLIQSFILTQYIYLHTFQFDSQVLDLHSFFQYFIYFIQQNIETCSLFQKFRVKGKNLLEVGLLSIPTLVNKKIQYKNILSILQSLQIEWLNIIVNISYVGQKWLLIIMFIIIIIKQIIILRSIFVSYFINGKLALYTAKFECYEFLAGFFQSNCSIYFQRVANYILIHFKSKKLG
eukprot:TRINITY_DN11373_c0_g1_i4.p1 TRINITY_DN11373_c0_g1~~TRINITY_DN11373_c0_g1_i4.p1  ORF type:complete len:277 (+),score=-12.93 TRINITY_DN11373_c0_g1_i4:176-1006(+)